MRAQWAHIREWVKAQLFCETHLSGQRGPCCNISRTNDLAVKLLTTWLWSLAFFSSSSSWVMNLSMQICWGKIDNWTYPFTWLPTIHAPFLPGTSITSTSLPNWCRFFSSIIDVCCFIHSNFEIMLTKCLRHWHWKLSFLFFFFPCGLDWFLLDLQKKGTQLSDMF